MSQKTYNTVVTAILLGFIFLACAYYAYQAKVSVDAYNEYKNSYTETDRQYQEVIPDENGIQNQETTLILVAASDLYKTKCNQEVGTIDSIDLEYLSVDTPHVVKTRYTLFSNKQEVGKMLITTTHTDAGGYKSAEVTCLP